MSTIVNSIIILAEFISLLNLFMWNQMNSDGTRRRGFSKKRQIILIPVIRKEPKLSNKMTYMVITGNQQISGNVKMKYKKL